MNSIKRLLLVVAVAGLIQAVPDIAMHDDPNARGARLVLGIGFVLVVSWFVGRLFSTLGLPKLTGYLATGMVAGPAVLSYLDHETIGSMGIVNGMAIALIALTAGSQMDFVSMRPILRSLVWMSVLSALGSAIILTGVTFALSGHLVFMGGMSGSEQWAVAALVGTLIAAKSPAVVVALRAETGADGPVMRTALGVVVMGDLLVIVIFAIVSSVANAVFVGNVDVGRAAGLVTWQLFGSLAVGTIVGGLVLGWQRFVGVRGLDLFVLVLCFVSAEVGRSVDLDPLLIMLAAGMTVQNVAGGGEQLRNAYEDASLPVYILFFTVAGASIHLDVLPAVALPAIVLVLVRAASMLSMSWLGARVSNAAPEVRKFAGFGLLPQAGLAIALSLLLQRTFPSFGEAASGLTLGIIAINEIIAPAVFRLALIRSGEADPSRPAVPH